jgi:DNA-binding transcriptional LysR family regulator
MMISQIRYVLAIAKYKSMRKAALHLFISQPTMSHQVAQLEQELGVALFICRAGRLPMLTSEGRRLLPAMQRLVDAHEDVLATAHELKQRKQAS